jgi:hypothetical protein
MIAVVLPVIGYKTLEATTSHPLRFTAGFGVFALARHVTQPSVEGHRAGALLARHVIMPRDDIAGFLAQFI